MNPRVLLHLEGAMVLLLSVAAYRLSGAGWGQFLVLFMAPDLSILGYLVNARVGAMAYNSIHTYTGPLLLAGYSYASGHAAALPLALIWIGHIGFDRMLGFGLKYQAGFKDTHLHPRRHQEIASPTQALTTGMDAEP